jgi:hypothetical protein
VLSDQSQEYILLIDPAERGVERSYVLGLHRAIDSERQAVKKRHKGGI